MIQRIRVTALIAFSATFLSLPSIADSDDDKKVIGIGLGLMAADALIKNSGSEEELITKVSLPEVISKGGLTIKDLNNSSYSETSRSLSTFNNWTTDRAFNPELNLGNSLKHLVINKEGCDAVYKGLFDKKIRTACYDKVETWNENDLQVAQKNLEKYQIHSNELERIAQEKKQQEQARRLQAEKKKKILLAKKEKDRKEAEKRKEEALKAFNEKLKSNGYENSYNSLVSAYLNLMEGGDISKSYIKVGEKDGLLKIQKVDDKDAYVRYDDGGLSTILSGGSNNSYNYPVIVMQVDNYVFQGRPVSSYKGKMALKFSEVTSLTNGKQAIVFKQVPLI